MFTSKVAKSALLNSVLIGLIACSSSTPIDETPRSAIESTTDSVTELLARASDSTGAQAIDLRLEAIETLLDDENLERAQLVADSLDNVSTADSTLQLRLTLVQARVALVTNQAAEAVELLTEIPQSIVRNHPDSQVEYFLLLGASEAAAENYPAATDAYVEAAALADASNQQLVHDQIWQTLQLLDDDALRLYASAAQNYALRGWIELTRVYRGDQFSVRNQLDAIQQWQRTWTQHAAAAILPTPLRELELMWENRPRHIALILPLQQPAGAAIQEGFLSAYYRALSTTRDVPRLSVYDSSNETRIRSLYNEAVGNGADIIIGPLNKSMVNELQQRARLPVPTLALNYADNPGPGPANLFQYGLAPEDEIQQAANLAWSAGYRNVAVMTPDGSDYLRLQDTFARMWDGLGGQVVSRTNFGADTDYADVVKRLMAIDSSESRASRLRDILPRSSIDFTPRRRGDIDFIFLIANPRQGRQIKPTLAFYYAENLPVISMPSINDGQRNQSANQDLDGIVFTDAPWVLDQNSALKTEVEASLRPTQGPLQRLRAMGIDAFMLHGRLQQMAAQDAESLNGTTGTLTMSDNRQIHRRLRFARFENGIARVISADVASTR
ncbi:MAG: penicillin-binding protein activator [Gammaproteobacteria bacterium]